MKNTSTIFNPQTKQPQLVQITPVIDLTDSYKLALAEILPNDYSYSINAQYIPVVISEHSYYTPADWQGMDCSDIVELSKTIYRKWTEDAETDLYQMIELTDWVNDQGQPTKEPQNIVKYPTNYNW